VLKLGTGHNMPTVAEVNAMLRRFGSEVALDEAALDEAMLDDKSPTLQKQ
jgi:hypothetical protein